MATTPSAPVVVESAPTLGDVEDALSSASMDPASIPPVPSFALVHRVAAPGDNKQTSKEWYVGSLDQAQTVSLTLYAYEDQAATLQGEVISLTTLQAKDYSTPQKAKSTGFSPAEGQSSHHVYRYLQVVSGIEVFAILRIARTVPPSVRRRISGVEFVITG